MKHKFCPKCGHENINNSDYCGNCGNKLDVNIIENNNSENITSNVNGKKGDTYALISLLLFYASIILSRALETILPENVLNVITSILAFCPLAGIVVLIIGRVNFPNNKFLKVVMWIFIVTSIIAVVYYIIAMIMCANLVSTSIESCKGIDG